MDWLPWKLQRARRTHELKPPNNTSSSHTNSGWRQRQDQNRHCSRVGTLEMLRGQELGGWVAKELLHVGQVQDKRFCVCVCVCACGHVSKHNTEADSSEFLFILISSCCHFFINFFSTMSTFLPSYSSAPSVPLVYPFSSLRLPSGAPPFTSSSLHISSHLLLLPFFILLFLFLWDSRFELHGPFCLQLLPPPLEPATSVPISVNCLAGVGLPTKPHK